MTKKNWAESLRKTEEMYNNMEPEIKKWKKRGLWWYYESAKEEKENDNSR